MIRDIAQKAQQRAILHFLSYVDMAGPDECWRWIGTLSGNYGTYYSKTHAEPKLMPAHRRSYELFVEPIERGLFVRHTCDHPWCVNPSHLSQGTQQDNMDDKSVRGRHHNQKLTTSQIVAIYHDPRTQVAIANDYGIRQGYVSEIKSGKKQARITRPKKLRKKFADRT